MTTDDLIAKYGSAKKAMEVLGFNYGTYYVWRKRGYIPLSSQYKIELKTNRKLKAKIEDVYGEIE